MRRISDISPQWSWYRIHWNRPFDQQSIRSLLEKLACDHTSCEIVFETRASKDGVNYFVATRPYYAETLIRSIEHFVYNTTLVPLQPELVDEYRQRPFTAHDVVLGHPDVALRMDKVEMITRGLLSALSAVRGDEEVVVQVMLGGRIKPFELPKNLGDPRNKWFDFVLGTDKTMSSEVYAGNKARHSNYCFQTNVRIGSRAKNRLRAESLIETVTDGLRIIESYGSRIEVAQRHDVSSQLQHLTRPRKWKFYLSGTEISCLMGIPYGEDSLPAIGSIFPTILKTPKLLNSSARSFAITNDPANQVAFGISNRDSLQHTLLLGPTGVGKSNTMLNMVLNDINDGLGVLVIDPKDDLNSAILERMNPERMKDVVYIDPSAERIVGLNPLSGTGDPDIIADGILSVFREVFADSWGQRTEDILSCALMTLVRIENATLSMLPSLLYNHKFRQKYTADIIKNDPAGLGTFWASYEDLTPRKQQEITSPLMNKLRTVLTRKELLRTIGQPNSNFDLSELFTNKKIVLVSLNHAKVGKTSSRFLGSLIVSQIWAITQAQAVLPQEKRNIVKVYIDEVQDYLALPLDLSEVLSQARSYGVGFTLAHQYRAQIRNKELLAGMDANIAHKVIFTLNDPDAKTVASMCNIGLSGNDFKYLKRFSVYIQTNVAGQRTWISADTIPAPKAVYDAQKLKQISLKRYGRSAEDVDHDIRESIHVDEDLVQKIKHIPVSRVIAVESDDDVEQIEVHTTTAKPTDTEAK